MKQPNTLILGIVIFVFSSCDEGNAQEIVFDSTQRQERWSKEAGKHGNIEYESIQIGNRIEGLEGALTTRLRNPMFCKFIELTDRQRKEILNANRDLIKKAKDEIKTATNESQISKILKKYSEEQEQRFERDILLPFQVKLANNFDRFRILVEEGPAKSLVIGTLGNQLDLSIDQRESLIKDIAKIRSEYEEKLRKARKEAIKKLIDAVPAKKRTAAKKYLNTLVETNMLIPQDRFLESPTELSVFTKAWIQHNNRKN